MPTVPTEQNRVGIAGLTGEKLQPGDYSGTGLQALGTGLQTLAATGRKVAAEQQERQDADDEYAVKAAWNDYAEQARTIRGAPPPDLDPEDAFNVTAQAYTDALGLARARLKNKRQQDAFAHVIGPRFDADISSARAAADLGMATGRDEQDDLIQRNAGQDAIDHFRQPEIFTKYLETGVESVRLQSMRRGDDPAMTAGLETAYRSGVHRGVIEALEQNPFAATTYYLRERAGMTERDRAAIESSLQEPLAQALAARDVDGLLPARAPGEPDTPATPEERAAAAQKIEATNWGEARKSRAREDLTRRALGENQRRKQAASASKEAALAAIQPLGLDFKSLTQLPGAIRLDLDEDTAAALARQAERNLDPAPVAPGGRTSLVMNLMATQNPEAFAREDLRLVQDLLTPEEYARFDRLQQGLSGRTSAPAAITQWRLLAGANTLTDLGLRSGGDIGVNNADAASDPTDREGWAIAHNAVREIDSEGAFARSSPDARPVTNAGAALLHAAYDPNVQPPREAVGGETMSSSSVDTPAGAFANAAGPEPGIGAKRAGKAKGDQKARPRHQIYLLDGKPYIGGQHIRSPEDQASNRTLTEEDLNNPAFMAYLTLVAITEGAAHHHKYYQRYGGTRLKDLKKFHYGDGSVSDASGMFQIQGNTFDETAIARLGLTDFSPNTQLLTAMFLLRTRRVRERLLAGDIKGAIGKGSLEWASLPDPETNDSRHYKSRTHIPQPSIDLDKAITLYNRLKTIWEEKLRRTRLRSGGVRPRP